ncbi:MAG TPA: winged helix-turn-helix domain-containing protein [Acidothermaceae bacterium]
MRVRAACALQHNRPQLNSSSASCAFDLLTKVAWRAGQRIELAPREWAVLELFMRNPTHAPTRQRTVNRVWEYGFDAGSDVVDVYVGSRRRKLNRPSLEPLLNSACGAGYRLQQPI